jgi:hypothetical protein
MQRFKMVVYFPTGALFLLGIEEFKFFCKNFCQATIQHRYVASISTAIVADEFFARYLFADYPAQLQQL